MTVNLSAIAASFGMRSPKMTPGILVFVAPYQPRTLSGASGLGSNVSCCPGPPHWWRKMTAFAVALSLAFGDDAAASICG